jgi:FkbM family methyltransferase
MKKLIKKIIQKILNILLNFLSSFNIGNFLLNDFISTCLEREYLVKHNNIEFKLSVPNALCYWRAKTFSTKEPETLSWIDSFKKKSVYWDIGCNVGLYAVYAAKRDNYVYGFEPSFFNLEIIARNIKLNNLKNNFMVLPIALNDSNKMSELKLTSSIWGSAHSTFDKDYTSDGSKINEKFTYQTTGFSIDEIAKTLNLSYPDYLKIDVDGIEHLILNGGKKVLIHVKSILIESSNNFLEQTDGIKSILTEAGFELVKEAVIDINYKNQIWNKKNYTI